MVDDKLKVADQVSEILKNAGSKERYIGIVHTIDAANTTAFIECNGMFYLAWRTQDGSILTVGQTVSFRIDQFRAKDIEVLHEG